MIVSYIIASILILPSVFCQAELATAMPKAGGTYFFVERSLGGLWGTFCGLANWLSLALKSAFAIVGIALFFRMFGQHLNIEVNDITLKAIGVIFCIIFSIMNLISVKHTTRFQSILVILLLGILSLFIIMGLPKVTLMRYEPFSPHGAQRIFMITGAVFISYGGLTKVASIAEEVKNPARNIPLGMIMSWLIVSFLYAMTVFVTVGTMEGQALGISNAPIAEAAERFMGLPGLLLLSVAAMAAFITTANGGILAASRSPMAMSRDHLLPGWLSHISPKYKTPSFSILVTSLFMICSITFLELEQLVKTASSLMLVLFVLSNTSVVIMRKSKILSYRPKFRSPLHSYGHIAAIAIYVFLLVQMGALPLLISLAFLAVSAGWYFLYACKRVHRDSAVMHMVQRVTDKEIQTPTLENELRDILFERDDITEDRFDGLIRQCEILDLKGPQQADDVFKQVAEILSKRLHATPTQLYEKLLQRESEGSTVIQPGLAIPHVVTDGKQQFDLLPVRAADGINFPHASEPVKTVFFLAGSKDERNYHLRALMAIAQTVQEKDFYTRWFAADNTEMLKNILLLSKRARDKE